MTWTMSLIICNNSVLNVFKITGQKMNCVYVSQPRTSAESVEQPAALFVVNLERIMFGSARDASSLPKGILYFV